MTGRLIRRWGFAAVGAFAAALIAGCQDGYPIAATRCDEWCDQMRRIDCGSYDPASCVAGCEHAGVGRAECAARVGQAVACLRAKTDHELACETWLFSGPTPCTDEQTAALSCGSAGGQGNAPGMP